MVSPTGFLIFGRIYPEDETLTGANLGIVVSYWWSSWSLSW